MKRDTAKMTNYLTPAEFAELMGVHVNTVRLWARDGVIPSVKLGRLTRIPPTALKSLPLTAPHLEAKGADE